SVPVPEWGFSSTPRVFGDQLVLEGGRVASFDKQTGKLLWQSAEHEAGYGSIAPLEFHGRLLFASLDCEGLRVLDSQDGTELAYYEWLSPFGTNSTTPIVQGDKIFISTGYNVGCGLFQFTGNSLELVYQSRDMRNHFNNSILIDGHLYGFDGNSNLGRVVQLTCLDFETGETKWQQAGYGCGSLMAADGKLLVLSDHGVLAVVEANPKTFGELARADILTNRCWTVPILADGHVFARNARGKLVCVKLPQSPAD
ncbi:MAG: PQQ-binding-like beta-propeller repeat protein, partial [Planctomycetaceae bacterium]|nr:PQQ-binding-like beta-propeller repeat protein [Planctomycetaceae bacterium]